jgi:hypothetical protein
VTPSRVRRPKHSAPPPLHLECASLTTGEATAAGAGAPKEHPERTLNALAGGRRAASGATGTHKGMVGEEEFARNTVTGFQVSHQAGKGESS